jgi:hypothetical protein
MGIFRIQEYNASLLWGSTEQPIVELELGEKVIHRGLAESGDHIAYCRHNCLTLERQTAARLV